MTFRASYHLLELSCTILGLCCDADGCSYFRIYLHSNLHFFCFQSKEECEYLIELAKPHMQKSSVVDSTTGKSKDSRYAYFGVFFLRCFVCSWRISTFTTVVGVLHLDYLGSEQAQACFFQGDKIK